MVAYCRAFAENTGLLLILRVQRPPRSTAGWFVQRLVSRFVVRLVTLLFVLNCGATLAAAPAWLHHEMEHALEHAHGAAGLDSKADVGEQLATEFAVPDHDDDSGIPHGALHAFAQLPATLHQHSPLVIVERTGTPPSHAAADALTDQPPGLPFKPPRL
jgi:hypothetical protein